ncbi:uncharacterized protein LOC143279745 [Babylonia areolata]|uniref:uncharacterized protein LOC143279745 n=1 Tax=Babylonia areolata TaxID=304850 RepID=UPI003FD67900
MSFDGVFSKWLEAQDKEDSNQTAGSPEQQQRSVGETNWEGDKLHGPQNASGTKSLKQTLESCALDIPPRQAGGRIQSSSSHSLRISRSLRDVEDVQSGDTVKQPYRKDRIKDCNGESNEHCEQAIGSMVDCKQRKQNMPAEGQERQQCHTHSPLTDLRDLSPTTSPAGVEGLRLDPVLSPEHDLPMEPDSTSECLAASKSVKSRKGCEVSNSMHKMYHVGEDFPCSTGESNPRARIGAVAVHVEESQAECDSTCMLLASPNAISPASQGEIEERVCPFLTDHEDGASPAHCVCQCRSLPPPANLSPRDHVPTITTATSASPPSLAFPHLTVRIIATKSDNSSSETKSKSPLISPRNHYECRTTSDLEHFATKLDLRRKKIDEKQQNKTTPVSLQGKECGKQYLTQYAETQSAVRVTASVVKKDSAAVVKSQVDLFELSTDKAGSSKHDYSNNSGELGVSAKCDSKQNDVCDFAKHIDWDTAVAETFESSTSVRGYDGESKPGIILKIRAKAVVPCLEKNLDPNSVKTASPQKRKSEPLGSPEILSRLRKRQKSEVATSETSCSLEQAHCEERADQCKSKRKPSRSAADDGCSCRNSATSKRKCRNTVQPDGDLKAYTKHLSPSDSKFVESSTRLSRLQTLTYNLVFSLFPFLRQQLNHITPESHHFTKIVDEIIGSLERSDSDEVLKDFEHLGELFEKLKVEDSELVPVFSPQVVLCSDPLHSLEDFQQKVCSLLQLLLPDLTISLSDCFLQSSSQLEEVVKRVLLVNKTKDKGARKCRVMSL